MLRFETLEKQNEILEKLNKTMDEYCKNKVKKWRDKSAYHTEKSIHYMYKYASIWNGMKANYHYHLAIYYRNRARGGEAIRDWEKQKENELNMRK